MSKCKYATKPICGGWICDLGYWNGKTTPKQCQICMALGRNNKETANAMKLNPREAWKMNSYSPSELDAAINKIHGAGDLIYNIAQPIAKTIDRILGTNIKECNGCKRRRKKLNQLFPIKQSSA